MNNPNNTLRSEHEENLFSNKYNKDFYNILFSIFLNLNEDKYFKLQSILLIKNILRIEINSTKIKNRGITNLDQGKLNKKFYLKI